MVLKKSVERFFVRFWTPFLKFRLDIFRIKNVLQSGNLKRQFVLVSEEQVAGNNLCLLGRQKAMGSW
jgi:hypothetical protein